jgi:putative DNA primase/helicase
MDGRNNSGFWLAIQLRDNGYGQIEAESVMRDYAARVPGTNSKGQREPYTVAEALASTRQAYKSPAREPWERRSTTYVMGAMSPAAQWSAVVSSVTGEEPNLIVQLFNDYGNGQRLIALHGDRMRYCHALNSWVVYDGKHWEVDRRDPARVITQETMLKFAKQALDSGNEAVAKFAGACLNTQRITAAMREAQPHLAITTEEMDSDPYLLAFQNGVANLKTGELMPHTHEKFIARILQHDYNPSAKCRVFLGFLARITAKHPELVGYLEKAFGYSLTGVTNEKAVFLLHGGGDNGKSTLLSTFLKLLGDYAVLLQIDTLMVRQESNNTQSDLADLRGARFVMTSETEEGQRLSEGKLKRITQGMGRIKATRKYENPVEFDESHKLWIDANHLPIIRGTDNAIWNRLHPIPFDTTIPKAEQDKELPDKLMAEAQGILAWAVAGAVRWYRERLGKPPDVERVGREWRSDSDQLGRFIGASCVLGEYAQVKARPLYQAYRKWAEEAGEKAETETSFSKRIAQQGFTSRHTDGGKVYGGIGLITQS